MASSQRDKTSTDRNKSSDDYNFYRVYSKDGAPVQVNQLFGSADSYLGCFAAKDIGPPHLALNVRRFLCKLEKIPTTTSTELYKDIHSLEPLGDRDRVDLSRSEGRKSKALIVKFLDPGSENVKEPDKPAGVAPKPAPIPEPVPTLAPVPAPAPTPRAPIPVDHPIVGQTYYIMNAHKTELCMQFGDDPHAAVFRSEAFVNGTRLQRGPSQQWTVQDAGSGNIYLRNGAGCYLTKWKPTSQAILGSTQAHAWKLQREGNHFKIADTGSRQVLDFTVSYGLNGGEFYVTLLSDPSGAAQQMWSFCKLD